VFKIDRDGAFKLCIFGDGGVGKTTLVQRYLTKIFNEDLKMTIGADFSIKTFEIEGKKVVVRIWDFAGEERFKVLLPSFAKGADGGLFMYDISRYTSVKNLDDWLSIFERNVKGQQMKIPIVMVVNDLLKQLKLLNCLRPTIYKVFMSVLLKQELMWKKYSNTSRVK
jgi:small GTP-binding protein